MRADAFYTNPRLTALMVLFVVILGGMAFSGLARQEDPTMADRYAAVYTFMPGATAERVEALITEPLETALREIPEIRKIESSTRAGLSVLLTQLYDHIEADEVDNIWSEVRDKLGDTAPTLPPGASEPELDVKKPLASTLIFSIESDSEVASSGVPGRIAEALRLRLANLPGAESAESWGEPNEEVLVSLDPYLLAASHVTVDQVAAKIRAADTKLASGRLRSTGADLLVEVEAELDSPERIAGIPLHVAADGSMLRLSDVADVRKHRVDPPLTMALHGTRPVILVNVKMQPGLQIGPWTERALVEVETLRKTLPAQIRIEQAYSQNEYTDTRMSELGVNLVFALLIVMLALVWLMGVRSALTVGVSLPLSAGMVLIWMQFVDMPLHQMSVTGLIISLGLLIDNAIVVVEEYKLNRARGADIGAAIARSVRHLLIPLGASTATTVFAFMPIALAPGSTGDFTGSIGIAVAMSVTSSYLLAMTVIPALTGYLENRWPSRYGQRWWQSGFSSPKLTTAYRAGLLTAVRRPALGITLGCIIPLLGFALAPTLTRTFFPPVDRNQFQVQLNLPAHAPMEETRAAIVKAEAVLRAEPEVVDSYWSIGQAAPRVYYNVVSTNENVASYAAAWVNTRSVSSTQKILPSLQAALSAALPDAEIVAAPFEQGPVAPAPIEVRIVGQDLEILRQKADELRRILAGVDKVIYTKSTLSAPEPKLSFVPNESAAARAGMSTGDLSARLNAALSGSIAGTVQEGSAELPVRVRLANEYRNNMSDLQTLPLLTNGGLGVPLDVLGEWRMVPAASAIERNQGERINSVHGFLVPFTIAEPVLQKFLEAVDSEGFELPAGYRLELGGTVEDSADAVGNLLRVFVLFVLGMLAVVTLSLNSFREAGLIATVGLLSFGLALFGVRLFGYPFGYMALIGSLGMMGLAINGSIIVLSALKANPRSATGDLEGTVDVVLDATRHIISTTVTTIGGFVPLIVAGGRFWPPLATAIAGGVAGSAIIALCLVPAVYVTIKRRNRAPVPANDERGMSADDAPGAEPVIGRIGAAH